MYQLRLHNQEFVNELNHQALMMKNVLIIGDAIGGAPDIC